MGSRGAGSGRVGSGGRITSFQDGDTTIDLSDSPLTYGGKDKALTGKAREAIEQFENNRYKNKIEYSTFVSDDGTVIENNKGGRGSVGASYSARQTADAMSHNHPRGEGVIGGTFSTGDMGNFVKYNQHTYRATAKEGTYSISKDKNFDGNGFLSAFSKASREIDSSASKENRLLNSKVRTGEITYEQAIKQNRSINNKMLVSMHNWLLDNQKKYNYTYTLEKRA